MAHVTFTYAGAASPATLTAVRPFDCYGFIELWLDGPNEGKDVKVGDAAGYLARARTPGLLDVKLDWELFGSATITGTPTADRVMQVRKNLRAASSWFGAAPGGAVTVTLVDDDASTISAPAIHGEFFAPQFLGSSVKVSQRLIVPDGVLS